MKIVKWIALGFGALVLGVVLLFVGARFADGPIAMIPGGAFRSGDFVEARVTDWSFVADRETIEMQLEGASTSRTTWIAVHDGKAYIPASLKFPPGKTWYLHAAEDGRAVLRIDGKLYRVMLRKLDDPAEIAPAGAAIRAKYSPPPGGDDQVWVFEVRSRPA